MYIYFKMHLEANIILNYWGSVIFFFSVSLYIDNNCPLSSIPRPFLIHAIALSLWIATVKKSRMYFTSQINTFTDKASALPTWLHKTLMVSPFTIMYYSHYTCQSESKRVMGNKKRTLIVLVIAILRDIQINIYFNVFTARQDSGE